ncbi:MAG: hypothetical protein JNM25_07595 [Planctomycetes bacterium]|nr:hypothetical protein [Planctomycetota bacterium]
MLRPSSLLLLLAATGAVRAQVQMTLTNVTPVTAQVVVGPLTDSTTVPIGAPFGLASASVSPTPGAVATAAVAWDVLDSPSPQTYAYGNIVQSLNSGSVGGIFGLQAGPHEFVFEVTSPVPVRGALQVGWTVATAAGATVPYASIDYGADGSVEYPDLGTFTAVPDLTGLVFSTTPTRVRVLVWSVLNTSGWSNCSLSVRAVPDNDLIVTTSAIGCWTLPLSAEPTFLDRGVVFQTLQTSVPQVLVLGLSQQPLLLPPYFGQTCLLLPALDIVTWNPLEQYLIGLPAAVRPVAFDAQAVAVTATGFVTTNALHVFAQ